MNAYALTFILCALAVINLTNGHSVSQENKLKTSENDTNKFEIYDGLSVELPKDEDESGRLLSIEINTDKEEGRGKKKKLLQNVLPLFIMPFLIQSAIIPLFLSMLKFMLVKSLLIGKLALALIMINAFKNSNKSKGRKDEMLADGHYGYHGYGLEEIGSYLNQNW